MGLDNSKLMAWPAQSPELNPIEHYWGVLKCKMYASGQQFSSKDELWEGVLAAARLTKPAEIKNLTSSMDRRLLRVLENKGGYIE